MPFTTVTEEDVTPLRQKWRSSVGGVSNASFNESGISADDSFQCESRETSKLFDIPEDDVRKNLDVSLSSLEGTSSADSSLLVKSLDSGVGSLEEHSVVKGLTREQLNYKFKISIYSKVSGCRMTNLTDYWIVKQIRVAALQHLADGNPEKALSFKFGYEKMANGGLQIVSDSEALIQMLGKRSYFAGIPCKMTFPDTPRVVGFIKGLPTDLEPSDLKDEIRKTYAEVYSVRYVTEKSRGFAHGMQRPCAFVSFNLRYLPKTVAIFNEVFELQVPNPMQCTRCCRYGHQGKQCRAQTRCSYCGGLHQRQTCMAKTPSCINCQGTHTATSHDCQIWQQGKYMNELRYRGGLTAEDAIGIASAGKVSQKKHSFTLADFFENQDSFFFGSDRESFEVSVITEEADEDDDEPPRVPQITHGKVPAVHNRAARIFPFLDMMTDLFLKVKNPGQSVSSSVLMPGYDEQGYPIRRAKKSNAVAQHFKESVIAAATEVPPS